MPACAERLSDFTGEAKPWENPTLLPGNQVSFLCKYEQMGPGTYHDQALAAETNKFAAMPAGYAFQSQVRRVADYDVTEQVPNTMRTEGELNSRIDPGMYDPPPGMYDLVRASPIPIIGNTFGQCDRSSIVIRSDCKAGVGQYDTIGQNGIGLKVEKKNMFLTRPNLKPPEPIAFTYGIGPRFVPINKVQACDIKTEGQYNPNIAPGVYEHAKSSLNAPRRNFGRQEGRTAKRELKRGLQAPVCSGLLDSGLKETQSIEYSHLGGGSCSGPVIDVAGWGSTSVASFANATNRDGKVIPRRPGTTIPAQRRKKPIQYKPPRCATSHQASRTPRASAPPFCKRGKGLARRQELKELMAYSEQATRHRPDRSGSPISRAVDAKPNCYVFHRDLSRVWVKG